jgi:hypothetical protein
MILTVLRFAPVALTASNTVTRPRQFENCDRDQGSSPTILDQLETVFAFDFGQHGVHRSGEARVVEPVCIAMMRQPSAWIENVQATYAWRQISTSGCG